MTCGLEILLFWVDFSKFLAAKYIDLLKYIRHKILFKLDSS